ncbi:MAG: PRC-barrel domain-containing protein [Candidatus Poseidonia sp.]|nr:PRC-barrel domain-containing protein [Poseidonia sp.]
MVGGVESMSGWPGLEVYLPDGRKLGQVYDAVIDTATLHCTHLFVRDTPESLVEGGLHVAVPWRWIRAVDDVVLLRWFPPTPIPIHS